MEIIQRRAEMTRPLTVVSGNRLMEHAFDQELAMAYGVDVSKLLISQPDYGEEAIDITESLIRSGKVKVIVIDSVASLIPKAELEADMEQQSMGLQARLMSKICSVHQ